MLDKYMFKMGSLYALVFQLKVYVHVWHKTKDDTIEKAIKAYEESLRDSKEEKL